MYPVPLLPHVCLDGVPREDRFREAGLDALHLAHVVPAVLPEDVSGGDAVGTQPVKDGGLESWWGWGSSKMLGAGRGGSKCWGVQMLGVQNAGGG